MKIERDQNLSIRLDSKLNRCLRWIVALSHPTITIFHAIIRMADWEWMWIDKILLTLNVSATAKQLTMFDIMEL